MAVFGILVQTGFGLWYSSTAHQISSDLENSRSRAFCTEISQNKTKYVTRVNRTRVLVGERWISTNGREPLGPETLPPTELNGRALRPQCLLFRGVLFA